MKRFACPKCRNEVHFESHACVVCGQSVGLKSGDMQMVPISNGSTDVGVSRCSNSDIAGCNWIAEPGSAFCMACRHNRIVPDHQNKGNRENWSALELAKRKLIYALEAWRLPHPTRAEDPRRGWRSTFLRTRGTRTGAPNT